MEKEEQFLLLSTIFCYLMLDFYVKTRIRFSLRFKRLFKIIEVEITRVDCIFFDIRGYFEKSVFEIMRVKCISCLNTILPPLIMIVLPSFSFTVSESIAVDILSDENRRSKFCPFREFVNSIRVWSSEC